MPNDNDLRLGGIFVEVDARTSKYDQKLRSIEQSAKRSSDRLEKSFKESDIDIDVRDVKKRMSDLSRRAKALQKDLERRSRMTFDDRIARLKISSLQKLQKQLRASLEKKITLDVSSRDLDITRQRLAVVDKALAGVNVQTKKATTGFSRFFGFLRGNVGALLGVGVGIGGISAALSRASDKLLRFDSGLRNANTIIRAGEGELKRYEDRLLSLQGEYGLDEGDLTQSLYETVSASVAAKDSLRFLESAAVSARAGQAKLGEAVDLQTTIMNAYKKGIDEVGGISDVVFKIIERGKTNFRALARELPDVTTLAASMGISFEQVGAAVASMTKQGIRTPEVMTQIRASIIGLTKALGDGWSETLTYQDALALVEKRSGGSQTQLLKMLGSVEAVNAVLALTGKNAKTAADDLKAMGDAAGSTRAAFNEQSKSIEFRVQKFTQAINANLIRAARAFADLLLPIPRISDGLDQLAKDTAKQRAGLNSLVRAIVATNDNQKLRNQLIDELEATYPSFLGNLDKESATNGQIEARLKAVNKELLNKIILTREDARRNEALERQADAWDRQRQATKALSTTIQAYESRLGITVDKSKTLTEQTEELVAKFRDLGTNSRGAFETPEAQNLISKLSDITSAVRDYERATEDVKVRTDEFNDIQKELGITLDSNATKGAKPPGPGPTTGKPVKVGVELEVGDSEVDRLSKVLEESEKTLFDTLKFEADGYKDFRIRTIEQIVAKYQQATDDQVGAEKIRNQLLKQLGDEEVAFFQEKEDKKLDISREQLTALEDLIRDRSPLLSAAINSIDVTFLSDMLVQGESLSDSLIANFKNMASNFVSEVERMIAKWLAFKAITAAANIFGIPVPAAASGGNFRGTSSGVVKAAGGADFTVPAGFPRDSFPMLVQSGERVSVQTPGQATRADRESAQMAAQLSGLQNSIQALVLNQLSMRQQLQVEARVSGKVQGRDIELSYDSSKQLSRNIR